MTPNWFATVALLAWPLVAICLYQTRPANQATLWIILGGLLLLPVGAAIKLAPGIPQLDKVSIPNLAALAGCILIARRPVRFWNGFGLAEALLLVFLIGPFVTSELNGDLIFTGAGALPSVGHYDALSAVVGQFLFLLPFFLGRQLLRSPNDNAEILRTLIVAGLLYSFPMLFEIRMSPQLHQWFYGYMPGSFLVEMRYGGFRPVIFMENGLVVAFFAMTATVAAAAYWRTQTRVRRFSPAALTAYLSGILILCKSAGALLYGATLVPLVRWTQPRTQTRIALILVTIALLYPLLRTADLVPTTYILDIARSVNDDRADSLQIRFDQEHQLLEHASQRLLFGWGRFGRNRVYDEYGKDISITDGRWIITLGQFGLLGFLAEFGLLALPVFRATSAIRFAASVPDQINLAALALILAINVVDLLPNASITPWTWLLAGALLGRAEALRSLSRQPLRTRPPQTRHGEERLNTGTALRK